MGRFLAQGRAGAVLGASCGGERVVGGPGGGTRRVVFGGRAALCVVFMCSVLLCSVSVLLCAVSVFVVPVLCLCYLLLDTPSLFLNTRAFVMQPVVGLESHRAVVPPCPCTM